MRVTALCAWTIVLAAACGGPAPKPEGPIVNEGSDVPEHCCCKSNPLTSEDGRPVFEVANRMECSSKQGQCMADVQCQASPQQPD